MPPKGATSHPPKPPPDAPLSAAAQQQKANSAGISEYELPKTNLTKLAKGSIPDNVKMQQDVVLALLRGSTMFISYLTAAAHDQAIDRSGKTITASDVIKAITELDFGPADALVPLLEQELAAYRANVQRAKAAKKPSGPGRGKGPRKSTGTVQGDDVEMGEGEGEEDEDDGLEVEGEGEGGEEEEEGGEGGGLGGDESEHDEEAG
ncbi:hypothetical protein IAR55_001288 [Kwoniella newhampshirensis]|uniref:DNA polymerase epsilon subunit D n=1 Tax=Kwoniella newhampshirensis TaxID=1651941 RepID=A0AAW0Z5S0_9TREE